MRNVLLAEPAGISLISLGLLVLLLAAGFIVGTIILVVILLRKSSRTTTTAPSGESASPPPHSPNTSPTSPIQSTPSTVVVHQCPKCGATLKADVPEGLCPACLLQQGIATEGGAPPGTPSFTPPPLLELAKLFPQLEILEVIGQGGMGAVYKARQPALDRFVALKILAPRSGGDLDFAGRFSREARALAKLSHPNIVGVYDFGQIQRGASSSASSGSTVEKQNLSYFIMEFVDGPNLRQVEQSGKLTPREALQIIPQICVALQFAHDEGIVHRDIKPENVLIDKKGRVKIADFGLAKILGQEADFRLTGARDVMGTPHYMAPEQVEKPQEVDHRADIYSLGVVFYEMLTGELPLGKFDPPSHKVQIDVRLDDVVLRSLANNPDRRYQHVSEVTTELESIAGTAPRIKPNAADSSRKVPILVASLVVCAVLLAVVLIVLARQSGINSHLANSAAADFASTNTVKAVFHIRSFNADPANSPRIDYSATLPSGYALQATASESGIAHSMMLPGSGGFYAFWNFPLFRPLRALRSPFNNGKPPLLPAPPKLDSSAEREAQSKILEGQLWQLQHQGLIPVIFGQPKLIFSVTNGSGDISQGFLELVRTDISLASTQEEQAILREIEAMKAKLGNGTPGTISPPPEFSGSTNFPNGLPSPRAVARPPMMAPLQVPPPPGSIIRPQRSLPAPPPATLRFGTNAPMTPEEQVSLIEIERARMAEEGNTGLIQLLPPPDGKEYATVLLAQQPPVVTETFPISGARDVPPGETEIRVRFSKTMQDGSWSWSTAWENSGPDTISSPHYADDGCTCVVRVRLEPGHTYAWWLNSEDFHNFKDTAGHSAVPYLLIFQTKPK